MRRFFLLVYLPEDRSPVVDHAVTPRQQTVGDEPHLTLESELGARQDADRETGILPIAEAASAGAEVAGDELIAHRGWPRPDILKTVIAHLAISLGQPHRGNEQGPLWFRGRRLNRLPRTQSWTQRADGAGCAS